jgi:hypothetical protein
MSSIGQGYLWPNIMIFSDGVRTILPSKPSPRSNAKPFRYFEGPATVVPSTVFEETDNLFGCELSASGEAVARIVSSRAGIETKSAELFGSTVAPLDYERVNIDATLQAVQAATPMQNNRRPAPEEMAQAQWFCRK